MKSHCTGGRENQTYSIYHTMVRITNLPPTFLVYIRAVIMKLELKAAVWSALMHQNTINKTYNMYKHTKPKSSNYTHLLYPGYVSNHRLQNLEKYFY
jgi:hypothetical protein